MKVNETKEIAQSVRAQEKTAVEVTEAHLAKIEQEDPQINSFNTLARTAALSTAAEIDQKIAAGEDAGPLAGVPVAVKDVICTKGIETTCSSAILKGWVPPYNATVVEKLLDAGAVPIGKTNCDEFGMGSSNENSAFGAVKNPLNTERVSGGSSGGSAAAVAAQFAPLALGTDTGGSVRQPASLCGIVGMKPTYGGVSRYGLVAYASSFDTVGVMGKTVDEAAMCYDAIAGHDPKDSTCLPGDRDSVVEHLQQTQDLEGLKVGVIEQLNGTGLDGFEPEVTARLNESYDVLTSAGAKVDTVSIPAIEAALSAYYLLAPSEASSNLARYDGVRFGQRQPGGNTADMMRASRTAGFGDEVKRRIMIGTYALSAGYYDAYYAKAQKLRALLIQELDRVYEQFDVLLSPTSPCVAFKFGAKDDPVSMYLVDVATIPANMAGHPGISVPFGTGADNLPVGLQIVGPKFGETKIFQVAKTLEQATSE